eukprot:1805010-Prorocentrum_lima.AAC.1
MCIRDRPCLTAPCAKAPFHRPLQPQPYPPGTIAAMPFSFLEGFGFFAAVAGNWKGRCAPPPLRKGG